MTEPGGRLLPTQARRRSSSGRRYSWSAATVLPFVDRLAIYEGRASFVSRRRVVDNDCPNRPCPDCDHLPGGWAGWCVQCGRPHEEFAEQCDRCEVLGDLWCSVEAFVDQCAALGQ